MWRSEAVLFGDREGVPLYRAKALLGAEAVAHVADRDRYKGNMGRFLNGYGIGDYTAEYLTKSGFMTAITFLNVKAIRAALEVEEGQSNE